MRPISVLHLALALLLGCSRQSEGPAPGSKLAGAAAGRNLILISLDTVRADRLGAWGYTVQGSSPSPRLDALMASGVRFERAMAPRAVTWPSLASVLTGLYPSGHGVAENGYELREGLPTLATLLQERGYRTGRFMSNMCTSNRSGWDEAFCSRGVDSRINPEVLGWLDHSQGQEPFFAWVHYFGAHSPYYNGGDRAKRRLDPDYDGLLTPKKRVLNRIMLEGIPLDERDLRHLDAIYDAAIMGTDRFAGELVDELSQRGLLDTSLLVVLSDHGEDLYDHNGYIYHACSVYQSGLHVPLALAAPGLLPPGAVVQQYVELLDVMPTVLALLGLDPPPGLHGRSLLGYLEAPDSGGAGKPAFSEYGSTTIHTVVDGDWKLIDNPDALSPSCLPDAPPGHYPLGSLELYNLAEDPLETRNLADQHPEKVAELRQLIRQRFADLPGDIVPQQIPEELKEELRALGYVAD